MKLRMHKQFCFILALILSMVNPNIALAEQQPVLIKTYGQHVAGNIVYVHQVTNASGRNVSQIAIGLDTDETSRTLPITREQGELNFVMPIGFETIDQGLNPASISGPTGWSAEIIQIEHAGRYLLWRRPPHPGVPLQSGQTYQFSVSVPSHAPAYLSGHFSARYAGYGTDPLFYNGVMEKIDITPPTLSLTLTPNTLPPSDKLVPITATISAKDDYDPAPEIKLESITPNEPVERGDIRDATLGTDDRQFMLKAEREGKNKAGRSYTVIYSATDASGNQSIASARITVPHDLREQSDHRSEDEKKDKDERGRDR